MTALNIGERLVLLSVIPKEGNFVTVRVIKNLISKVALTDVEIGLCEVTEVDGNVRWNEKGELPFEFEFEPTELDIIKKTLRELDSTNKLNVDSFSLYEKFCA
jgi:hypothetical protein